MEKFHLPPRGLRQGDPLYQYLFLTCVEGFLALVNAAEEEGKLQGIAICENAPSVTHLFVS